MQKLAYVRYMGMGPNIKAEESMMGIDSSFVCFVH